MSDFITFGQLQTGPPRVRVRRRGAGGEIGASLINALMSGVQNRTSLDLLAMQLAAQKEEGSAERGAQSEMFFAQLKQMKDENDAARKNQEKEHSRLLEIINTNNTFQGKENQAAREAAEANENRRHTERMAELNSTSAMLQAQMDEMKSAKFERLEDRTLNRAALQSGIEKDRAGAEGKTARTIEEMKLEQQAAEADSVASPSLGAIEQYASELFGVRTPQDIEPALGRLGESVGSLESLLQSDTNPLLRQQVTAGATSLADQLANYRSDLPSDNPLLFGLRSVPGLVYRPLAASNELSLYREPVRKLEQRLRTVARTPGVGAAAVRATRAPERAEREAMQPGLSRARSITDSAFNPPVPISIQDAINEHIPGLLPDLPQSDFVGPQFSPDTNNEQVHTPVSFGQPVTSLYNLPEILDAGRYMSSMRLRDAGVIA